MNLNMLNILLVDDDTDDCYFFKSAVEEYLPYVNLIALHDGEQLMQLLQNETNKLPNVIFLDLNMPRKNGFECLTEIKLNEQLRQIPVVIFSTSFEQEVVNQLYMNGAHYFIRKPAEFSQFKKIIYHTLKLIEAKSIKQPSKEDFVIRVGETVITY